ncbi:hypothetical protein AVEN_98760-1 [Araneus ventricosus]|uniref:Uncharacterized protein n=1 Tax=Araneus ventricosus TaxID=182803 RepID=A0A4Y2FNP0_ARAVE|nr:hypothetical protein AVEN_98760-1 [Araneus ventricosus]
MPPQHAWSRNSSTELEREQEFNGISATEKFLFQNQSFHVFFLIIRSFKMATAASPCDSPLCSFSTRTRDQSIPLLLPEFSSFPIYFTQQTVPEGSEKTGARETKDYLIEK